MEFEYAFVVTQGNDGFKEMNELLNNGEGWYVLRCDCNDSQFNYLLQRIKK